MKLITLLLLTFTLTTLKSVAQASSALGPSAALMEVIGELDGTSSYTDGPNCWNGAIYAAGVVPSLRMFHPDEWLYHLKNNCFPVAKPSPGDVGRIYSDQAEVHGFIYLGPDEVFAKHGEQTQWGYRLMSTAEMLDSYERSRNCRINRDYSPECYHQMQYYRCEGISQEAQLLKPLGKALERLNFDRELRPHYKLNCESTTFLTREEILKDMSAQLGLLELVSEEYRAVVIESYLEALSRIQVSQRQFRCEDRKRRDRVLKKLRERLKALRPAP